MSRRLVVLVGSVSTTLTDSFWGYGLWRGLVEGLGESARGADGVVTAGLAAAEPGGAVRLDTSWLESGWLGTPELGTAWLGTCWSPGSFRIVVGAGAYFAGPHVTCGSVPTMKAIITGRTQPPPGFKSTGTTTTLSGAGKSSPGVPANASDMKAVQIGTATREPVSSRPRLRGRS